MSAPLGGLRGPEFDCWASNSGRPKQRCHLVCVRRHGAFALPRPRRSLVATLQAWLPPRRGLTIGLSGVAAAASLVIVFAPSLRSQDDHLQETTENEAQIHSIEVSSPDRSAIVFESAEGNTVIWMVPSAEEDAGQLPPVEP